MTLQEKTVSYIVQNPHSTVQEIMGAVSCGKSVAYAALSAVEAVKETATPNGMLNVVAIGDMHCGHKVGLTPPEWYVNKHKYKLRSQQEEMWEFYASSLKNTGKIDILFVNGDSIDGSGKRSGGTELLTTDRHEQCDIATRCIQEANADKVYMTFGTPYHTGVNEDFETIIAKNVNAVALDDQLFVNVNGIIFDVKHHTNGSVTPYGRATAIGRSKVWNTEWSETGNQPKANCFLRSHVHYDKHTGDSKFIAMTLPALQGPDTKYGGRRCEGTVSFGLTNFKVAKNQKISNLFWEVHTKDLETFKQELLVA